METGLRVVHVVPQAPGGRAPIFTERQIDMIERAGVRGKIVFLAGNAMARTPHRLPSAVSEIRTAIRDFKPDIVHAHWGSLLAFVAATASIGGPPLVISFRGSDINPVPSESRARSAVRIACSQAAALLATAIVCVSWELKDRLWFSRRKARVVPDGTDLTCFAPRDRASARRTLRWPADEPVVLFNEGARPKVKRLDIAVAAVDVARTTLPRLRLELMQGDLSRDEVAMRINASDCVLMTSDFEGSPNIVREALACDTPVVSVPVGDVPQWLEGLDGVRLVSRDPASVGAAVASVITAGVRPAGRQRAEAFSEEASLDAVLAVYHEITTDRARLSARLQQAQRE